MRRSRAGSEQPRSRVRRRPTRRKNRAEKALEFLVAAFRKPDPALDGRSLKVVDLLDGAVKEINHSFHDQPSDGSDSGECDRPDLRRAGAAGEVAAGV